MRRGSQAFRLLPSVASLTRTSAPLADRSSRRAGPATRPRRSAGPAVPCPPGGGGGGGGGGERGGGGGGGGGGEGRKGGEEADALFSAVVESPPPSALLLRWREVWGGRSRYPLFLKSARAVPGSGTPRRAHDCHVRPVHILPGRRRAPVAGGVRRRPEPCCSKRATDRSVRHGLAFQPGRLSATPRCPP